MKKTIIIILIIISVTILGILRFTSDHYRNIATEDKPFETLNVTEDDHALNTIIQKSSPTFYYSCDINNNCKRIIGDDIMYEKFKKAINDYFEYKNKNISNSSLGYENVVCNSIIFGYQYPYVYATSICEGFMKFADGSIESGSGVGYPVDKFTYSLINGNVSISNALRYDDVTRPDFPDKSPGVREKEMEKDKKIFGKFYSFPGIGSFIGPEREKIDIEIKKRGFEKANDDTTFYGNELKSGQ